MHTSELAWLLKDDVDGIVESSLILCDTVTSFRKGDRILSVGALLVRKDGKVKLRDDFSLEIVDVEESDAGQYSCQLDVFGNTQTLLHNLTVLGRLHTCRIPPFTSKKFPRNNCKFTRLGRKSPAGI